MTIRTTVSRSFGHRRSHAEYHRSTMTADSYSNGVKDGVWEIGDWAVMWAEPTEHGYKFAVVAKGFATRAAAKRWWMEKQEAKNEPLEDEAPGAVWKP